MKKFSIVFKSGLTLNIMANSCVSALKEAMREHTNLKLRDVLRVSENKYSKMVDEPLIEGEILN